MRSRFLTTAFIVSFAFMAFATVQANAQYIDSFQPGPAVRALPNVVVAPYVGPAIGYSYTYPSYYYPSYYYPSYYYPSTYYWSAGYTYPAIPAYYPTIPATYYYPVVAATPPTPPYFPSPVYVAPYHAAFYSSYYYPYGYGTYYRGW